MTKEEFIKNCQSLGYCTKKEAEKYCEGKDELTDDDFIEVHRSAKEYQIKCHGRPLGEHGYTSKRFFGDGGSEGNR